MSSEIDTIKLELQPFVKRSFTTGPGNAPGTTLVDAALVEPNDFWNDCWVLIRTGTYARQLRRVVDFDSATNTLTLDHTVGGLIAAGIQYVMGVVIPTQDTGLNTNPEKWMHDHHWDSGAELVLNAAAPVNLVAPVAAGATRRVRSITVRNTALANTVITVSQLLPLQNRVSFDVPAQTTRVWSEEDGVEFLAAVQVQISSSAAAVGSETYIHASGVEA